MKFIVKVFPEIIMKSDSIKKRFIKVLWGNIQSVLMQYDKTIKVVRHWDFIEVRSKDESKRTQLRRALTCIPGIHHILEVDELPFVDLHDIFEQTLTKVRDDIKGKTFCVRVKRRGKHDFDSMDVMRYVGGGLNQHIDDAKVCLTNPQVVVRIEIEHDKMMLVQARHEGLGGFPISTQEDVLSLISGGFDSGVASHMFTRRGSRVHYIFFNLGGRAHELGTKQMAYHLWQKYGSSHRVKFFTVDFEPVVAQILKKIDDGQMGVILKRMMVRAASVIAKRYRIEAIVTGEALGQVASQTLTNLRVIDQASQSLILRPLITHDKQHIINMAERIGTADIAKSMPEYCGVISKKPTVKAVERNIVDAEANFDFNILQNAIDNAVCMDIKEIVANPANNQTVQSVNNINADDVVIDIRSIDEVESAPLNIKAAKVIHMPFYRLATNFGEFDQSKTYLLYCQRGVMSALQAASLKDKGFDNIKILKLA